MKRVTVVIQYDSSNTYFLGVDLETGSRAFEAEAYTYEDGYNEDHFIAELAERYNVDIVETIHW